MEKSVAVNILEQVAQLAQKGGLLNLQDVPAVIQAIEVLKAEFKEEKPD